MNKIISNLLSEFRKAQNIDVNELESVAFEHFSAHIALNAHTENTSILTHTLIGSDAQPSVDVIGIIVNGKLIENQDEIDTCIDFNKFLEIDFIFVQAKTSESFDVKVLADIGDFSEDFIQQDVCTTDTIKVKNLREIKNYIYDNTKFFTRRNPNIHIYYITTGKTPSDDVHFDGREDRIKRNFENNGNVEECNIHLIGSKEIQDMNRQINNSIERQIELTRKITLPKMNGVDEAYLSVISAQDFLTLLQGQGNNILSSIFYDNVRDWQGENVVNSAMSKTLNDEKSSARFVLMNNGVTVIAKKIRVTGDIVTLEDYQIVNGCQTSNVIWNNKNNLNNNTLIPLRLIATTDENVITDIIKATNSQTEITTSQLLAATDFQKELESYFSAQSISLFYERRSKQFYSTTIDRASILTPINLLKSYASMILEEPHKTTRDFQSIVNIAGKTIFGAKHKIEIYYMCALAQYWLDQFLRKDLIDKSLKIARFQILLAFKLIHQNSGMPPVESNKAKTWANELTKKLATPELAYDNFRIASNLVSTLILQDENKNKRDAARSSYFTRDVITQAKNLALISKQ